MHPVVQSPRAAGAQGADEVRSATPQVHSLQCEGLGGRDTNGFALPLSLLYLDLHCMYVCMYVRTGGGCVGRGLCGLLLSERAAAVLRR